MGARKLDEAKASLEGDFPEAAAGLEELLAVPLAYRQGNVAEVHSAK